MKVLIAVGVHPRFKRFIENLPKDIDYEIRGVPDIDKYYTPDRMGAKWHTRFSMRNLVGLAGRIAGIPRMKYYRTDADVIYSTRGILPLNRKPWIVETEHPYGFVGMDYKSWGWRQKAIVKMLLRSRYCRGIVVVTDAAKKTMEHELKDKEISKKISVIYTSVNYKKIKKAAHRGVTLLTIANADVYSRGFGFLKQIYPALKRKYDVNWILKANQAFSEEDMAFIRKYGIKLIRGNFDENQINSLFSVSDIFINVSFVDTNSNVIYEAMSAGLPVIAADVFSGREKIKDGYNGFLIPLPPLFWDKQNVRMTNPPDFSKYQNKKVSSLLQKRIETLIKSGSLRERMGKRNVELIKNGRFSMKRRVAALKEIFESAYKR